MQTVRTRAFIVPSPTLTRLIAWVVTYVAISLVAGCTSTPEAVASKHGLVRAELQGTVFTHTAYYTPASSQSRDSTQVLWVFIDGDGRPWINGGREPAHDPTTSRPIALELAVQMPGPVLHIGRPCYDRRRMESSCTATWWTDARYSRAVVESMVAAIRRYQHESHLDRIVLVGYSGGGALAVLAAPQLNGVVGVVTIAANLDVSAWTQYHGYLPLTASLNPTEVTDTASWPEMHLVGEDDEIVPPHTVQRYFERHPRSIVWRYPDYGHVCCWRESWPSIIGRIEAEIH
jgi:pimeloyl-ACP methyl ester carboxylesterase